MHRFSWLIFRNKTTNHEEEVALLKASTMFDEEWYLEKNPKVRKTGIDPVSHYLKIGAIEGLDPSASFSNVEYIKANPDVGVAKINPLLHYVMHGLVEGRPIATTPEESVVPTPSIYGNNEDLSLLNVHNRLLRQSLKARLEHLSYFLRNTIISESTEIEISGLFDEVYYRENNRNVNFEKEKPIDHFNRTGWRIGKKPNPDFDPDFYRRHYEDILRLNLNPLIHYINYGIIEGREPIQTRKSQGTLAGSDVIHTSYQEWVKAFDTITEEDVYSMKAKLNRFKYLPTISIIMPVYKTNTRLLTLAINSVLNQTYTNFELCIADDNSGSREIKAILENFKAQDERVKITFRGRNGHISAASNSALALATGEFIALMDHDDLIPQNALFEIINVLNENRHLDVIYSDEDRVDENGNRFNPYFKTKYNKELMLGHNAINHFAVYRSELVNKVGGFRKGYEGSQDYDLALRVIDVSDKSRIHHIPSILYHWRIGGEQSTYSEAFMEQCISSARNAIRDHLLRNNEKGIVTENSYVKSWHRVTRSIEEKENKISVIVPTKDQHKVLEVCCRGVLEKTDYKNLELIIVNHQSVLPETYALFKSLSKDKRVRILDYKGPFNYSAMNNMAAIQAKGNIICLLNNDVEVINGDWLHEMASQAILPDVGIVGAKLLYPDGRTQHGGVILGVAGVAGHRFHLMDRNDIGPSGLAVLSSDVSAITAACIVVKKNIYQQVGGLDEENLKVAFNDVDLSIKVMSAGYRNVYNPYAVLYHHESLSRGSDLVGEKKQRFMREVSFMLAKWEETLKIDPFYNPNLNLSSADYSLSWPPRISKPWLKS